MSLAPAVAGERMPIGTSIEPSHSMRAPGNYP